MKTSIFILVLLVVLTILASFPEESNAVVFVLSQGKIRTAGRFRGNNLRKKNMKRLAKRLRRRKKHQRRSQKYREVRRWLRRFKQKVRSFIKDRLSLFHDKINTFLLISRVVVYLMKEMLTIAKQGESVDIKSGLIPYEWRFTSLSHKQAAIQYWMQLFLLLIVIKRLNTLFFDQNSKTICFNAIMPSKICERLYSCTFIMNSAIVFHSSELGFFSCIFIKLSNDKPKLINKSFQKFSQLFACWLDWRRRSISDIRWWSGIQLINWQNSFILTCRSNNCRGKSITRIKKYYNL